MKKVYFSGIRDKDKYFLVDDEDYDRLRMYKWYLSNRGYATKKSKVGYSLAHRMVITAFSGQIVDHINRDKLDNRKINLRICTQTENLLNSKLNIRNTSGYKGVSRFRNGWKVYFRGDYLGVFKDIGQAHQAYQDAYSMFIYQ